MPTQEYGQVTVLLGPAGSGKTAAALAEYGDALRRGGLRGSGAGPLAWTAGCLWISLTRTAAADMRESLTGASAALLAPGITTWGGCAAEVVRDAGLLVMPINALQRRRLLRRLIDEAAAAGELEYYAPLAATPGLAAIVDEAIAEVQSRGLTPAEVDFHAGRADAGRPRDVALLFGRYCERLAAGGLVDAETLLTTAAGALAASRAAPPELELVVVDGFASFTVVELRLLEQLARRARRVVVTLLGEAAAAEEIDEFGETSGSGDSSAIRGDLFSLPLRTIEALSAMGRISIKRSAAFRGHEAGAWAARTHLERNLFRSYRDVAPPTPAVVDSLDRIHVIAASGVQAEIVEVARRVKRLLVAGVAPGDIVVALRSTREVADRVRLSFDDYGIPMHIGAGRLSATALARTLTCVLRLAAEDWPYRRVLQAIGDRSLTIFSSPSESLDDDSGAEVGGADARVRRAMELCVRHAQLPSGRKALFGQLAMWAADAERTSRPAPAEASLAGERLGRLAGKIDVLPRQATIDRWVVALGSLAHEIGLLHPATEETAANWSILARAIRSAARLDAATGQVDAKFTLAEFAEIVAACAAQTSASESHDAVGRVRVLNAEAARLTRPRHLFVAGLSEQSFPAPHRASAALGEDAMSAADARSAEMLLFYQLVTRATETLTLSYPALDERAQALPASPFLVEFERAFAPAELTRSEQPLNYARPVVNDGETPLSRSELRRGAVGRALTRDRDLLASLAADSVWHAQGPPQGVAKRKGGNTSDHAPRGLGRATPSGFQFNIGAAILAGIDAVADRGQRESFGEYEGVVSSPAASAALLSEYGQSHLWSPSRLERYAECPFLFFGEQLLHLEPTPELALASDVRRRGSLLHDTLARLYAELRSETIDAEKLAEAVTERFHASLAAAAATRPGRGVDAAIREIERRQIAAWAEMFAQQDAAYRSKWAALDVPPAPAYFEARFGPANKRSESRGDATLSTDEPFRLTVPVEGKPEPVQFAGQVDRIDVGRVGAQVVFNVIDYKTSERAQVRDTEIHAGRQIQLPLYALAVEHQLLAAQEASALAAGFWSIRGRGFVGSSRSGGPLDIREVRDGVLKPAPAWDATREKLLARIGEIVAHIRRGYFPVFNEDQHCTEHCDLRTICRIAQVRSLDKEWIPPDANAAELPHAKAQRSQRSREEKGNGGKAEEEH